MKTKTIKLRGGKAGKHKAGHPWIFRNQLLKGTDPAIKPGDIISVVDEHNVFLGRGYYNPHSEIAIRLLSFTAEPIDAAFFHRRIAEAVGKRQPLIGKTNAYRAVFSEADGLPGLIIDVYGDTAVFQILTFGMEKQEETVVEAIRSIIKPAFLYEKSISPYRQVEGLKDVSKWVGEPGSPLVEIREGDARYLVDIARGHKTGFYLDQRKSRLGLAPFCKNAKVLDLFCYTGGFSVSAALAGAAEVTGVDVKREWLELAEKNATLNVVDDRVNFIEGDVFEVVRDMAGRHERFDLIILDPPSFLKTRESLAAAARGYKELNFHAMSILKPGGVLGTFSCSHNMPNETFSDCLKKAAKEAKREFTVLKRCHQAEDHPIIRTIPETEYLKGYFLKVT